MRKTILTAAGSALIVLSAVQFAAAAPTHHRSHKADRAPTASSEQFRNSNAAWPAESPLAGSAYNGGMSAPAGH
jgi:hypothetical protein